MRCCGGGQPILVPGARLCDGHGLAFVGHHDSVLGALKSGDWPRWQWELGLHVCGAASPLALHPAELLALVARFSRRAGLVRASPLVAKVTCSGAGRVRAVPARVRGDDDGKWTVVQQG